MTNTRNDLTNDHTGRWLVTTGSGSVYLFDLDERTVERTGGEPRPPEAPSDSQQPLRGIIEIRVGLRGRWWIRNTTGGYADPSELWQWSSSVVVIEQESEGQDDGR
jgi:hypothetical protein